MEHDSSIINYSAIHVLGGARGVGRWFAEHIFAESSSRVCLYDVAPLSTPINNPTISFAQITYANGSVGGFPSIDSGHPVVFSIPVHEIKGTANAVFPLLPDDTLVLDMSSVKVETHALLEEVSSGRLQIMGVHPLFGPQVPSPVGQSVALTGYDDNSPGKRDFREMLKSAGLLVAEMTPLAHDNAMLYIQSLTHFTYLTFAQVLSKCPQKLEQLLKLATPPFQVLSSFAGRILGSPLATYANIQRLHGAENIRRQFIEAAQQLNEALSDGTSLDNAITAMSSIVKPFSGAEIAHCKASSATAIDSIQVFEHRLFSLAKSARLCGIYRIDTKDVIPCKVCHIKSDRIVVDEQFIPVKIDGHMKYAIAVNDTATRNYRRRGINISQSHRCEMLKRNIRILSDADFNLWIRDNILPISNDVNIQTRLMVSDVFCERWLPELVPGILSLSFVEAYRRKGQPEKILLRIVYTPELELSKLTSQIQQLLDEVGTLGGIVPNKL